MERRYILMRARHWTHSMRINEIFYSLQGEGAFTGCPCVFVRFSGCNQHCPFCDTEHDPYKEMAEHEVLEEVERLSPHCQHIVLTGGEPTLQITESFLQALKAKGYSIHIETNGSIPLTPEIEELIDWVTVSPKALAVVIERCEELKLLYGADYTPEDWAQRFPAALHFLQPVDRQDESLNARCVEACIDYIKLHPRWRLSLQTHKLLNIR